MNDFEWTKDIPSDGIYDGLKFTVRGDLEFTVYTVMTRPDNKTDILSNGVYCVDYQTVHVKDYLNRGVWLKQSDNL